MSDLYNISAYVRSTVIHAIEKRLSKKGIRFEMLEMAMDHFDIEEVKSMEFDLEDEETWLMLFDERGDEIARIGAGYSVDN